MSKTEKPIFTLNKREEDIEDSKIELIKNLIFGDQIKEYDAEFERLKKDILEKKQVLETLVEQVKTEIDGALTDVSTDVNIRITELEESLENKLEDLQSSVVDRKILGKMFTELGKKLEK